MAQEKITNRRAFAIAAFLVIIVGGGIGALAYLAAAQKTVYIDKAALSAPVVELGPSTTGVLTSVTVQEGDYVPRGAVVAVVGNELIKTQSPGLVTLVNNNIGKLVNPGEPVVEIIDPSQLRVVGQVQEDKGLSDIHPGQRAAFEVDAFGSKQFSGIVDEVAPTAQASDVVFTVSDQRQEQNFEVKVRFDTNLYPELKNGMSAKIWVYKQ